MGWNGNDIQYLSTIDRVKRLERSTLEPNESGDYDETSPNLTERVVALEVKFGAKYGVGDTLPTPEIGSSHTYLVVGNGVPSDDGAGVIVIDSKYLYDGNSIIGSTLIISNVGGTLYFTNGVVTESLTNLTITNSDYLSLLRFL